MILVVQHSHLLPRRFSGQISAGAVLCGVCGLLYDHHGYYSLLPELNNIHVRSTGGSKLTLGVKCERA